MKPFATRLADAVLARRNPLCVGLDPRWESLPDSIRLRLVDGTLDGIAMAYREFCLRTLDIVAEHVPAVKPQSAFFEACGPRGLEVMRDVIARALELGLVVILDAKRGDIASTAVAYAEAAFAGTPHQGRTLPVWHADALTVNPYLGRDAVEPFITTARQSEGGLFILVRTSNPGSGLFQELDCGGRKLYEVVADSVSAWNAENLASNGYGDCGAVVGATHPRELVELRARMPGVWLLVPGYGAQGGTAADVAAAFDSNGLGGIVNSSRGITFPFKPEDANWESAILAATKKAVGELRAAAGL